MTEQAWLHISFYTEPGAYEPIRAHEDDAGADLRTPKDVTIGTRSSAVIDTGVHVNLPKGYVGMLKAKSGLNIKHDIIGTGVVDAGYTGSIVVKLYNLGDTPYEFKAGDKIIQLVISPIITPTFSRKSKKFFTTLDTERKDQGFGSTGV